MSELRARINRLNRICFVLLVALFLATTAALSRPPSAFDRHDAGPSRAEHTVSKSSYSATWVLHTLPPLGASHETFDETLLDSLEVRICREAADGTCDLVERLIAATGDIRLTGDDDNGAAYRMHWAAPSWLVGTELQIRCSVAGLAVGTFGYMPRSTSPRQFRFTINDHPLIRARLLRSWDVDAFQLADVVVDEFALGPLEVVRILTREGYAIVDVGDLLLQTFGQSPEDAAWLIRATLLGADDAGTVLRDAYAQDVFGSSQILKDVGYSCSEIDRAVRELFGGERQGAVAALTAIDCAPDPLICTAPDDVGGDLPRVRTRLVDSLSAVMELRGSGNDEDWNDNEHRDFDRTLLDSLRITIAETHSDGSLTVVSEIAHPSIRLKNDFYYVNWRPDPSFVGQQVRMTFSVANLDVLLLETEITSRRTLPVKFRVDNHPVLRARVLREAGFGAAAIVAQLLGEFRLEAGEVAKILFEEEFTILELATGLRDGLPADAAAVTAALREGGIPATLMLQALDEVFDLTAADAVPIMRGAGYEAADVWRALDVVLGLDDGAIETLLRQSGYSEEEILVALAPRLLSKYACLIERSGPKIHFHPEEPYFPSSVDWFMSVSPLVWGQGDDECQGCRLAPGEVNAETLLDKVEEIRSQNPGELDFWFDLPEPTENPLARQGNLAGAKMYVHAIRLRDLGMTDLQFWLFYPYNGPGSMTPSSDLFGLGNVCTDLFTGGNNKGNVAPLGEHESDWEVVVLRFDDATNDLVEVYLSAHGDYIRYPISLVEQEDGQHVVAYSALNGHAFFPHAGQNPHREKYVDFVIGDVELKTLNWAARGQSLPTWMNYEIVGLDGAILDVPWLHFDGVWGETVEFGLSNQDKINIVYEVADDCLLAVRTIHIPIAALASSAATCAVFCAPAAAIFGFGYGACLAGCIPGLTATLTIGANIALDPVIQHFAPDIVDDAFPDQTGTGKPTPASRGVEWRHFRLPNEKPRILRISDVGDPTAETRTLVVNIPGQVCERKGDKWLLGPPLCVDTPQVDRVELGIDGVYTDITASAQTVGGETLFTHDWNSAGMFGQSESVLSPRYSNPAGIVFEYSDPMTVATGAIDPVIDIQLDLQDDAIGEGETAVLDGTFASLAPAHLKVERRRSRPTGRKSVARQTTSHDVTIEWGDGDVDSLSTSADSFTASHAYVDDGLFTINVSVDDGTLTGSASERLVVGNRPPQLGSMTQSPSYPSILDAPAAAQLSASFTDPGTLDTHDAEWDWGDGTSDLLQGIVSPVAASHTYLSQGLYEPMVTIADDDGALGRAWFEPVLVSEPGGTAGAGSILAPIVNAGEDDATFTFDLSMDAQNQPVVNLGLSVASLAITGVRDPVVVFTDNQVQIEGGVTLNGEETADGGEPYLGRVIAVDEPSGDTFEMRVWFVDANDV